MMSVLNTKAAMVAVGVVTGGVVLYVAARQAGGAVAEGVARVGQAVNPTSPDNIAYSGVNAVGAALSGDKQWSLGSALYDWGHPPDQEALKARGRSNSTR